MNRYFFLRLFFLIYSFATYHIVMPMEPQWYNYNDIVIRDYDDFLNDIFQQTHYQKETLTLDGIFKETKKGYWLSTTLNKALSKAIYFVTKKEPHQKVIVEALLMAGADANYKDGYGRPLDKVVQLSNIEVLLRYKANPKLCKKSPIITSLHYYMRRSNTKEKRPNGIDLLSPEWKLYFKNIEQEQIRRAHKALQCMKLLLQAGADVHQKTDGIKPLKAIINLIKDYYLPLNQGKQMAKVLISYGADSEQSSIGCGLLPIPYNGMQYDVATFEGYAHQEREKYQAIRQLLIGHKDKSSPLSILPKNVVQEIGLWVKG